MSFGKFDQKHHLPTKRIDNLLKFYQIALKISGRCRGEHVDIVRILKCKRTHIF